MKKIFICLLVNWFCAQPVLSWSGSEERPKVDVVPGDNMSLQKLQQHLEQQLALQRETFLLLMDQNRLTLADELEELRGKVDSLIQGNLDLASKNRELERKIDVLQASEEAWKSECREFKSLVQRTRTLMTEHELSGVVKQDTRNPVDVTVPIDVTVPKALLHEEAKTKLHTNQTLNPKPAAKHATRSDDASPLEATVSQLSQQVVNMAADIQSTHNKNTQQDAAIRQASGSTFVRWGRSYCPSTAELVYSGYLGGGDTARVSGSPSNRLCLVQNPVLLSSPGNRVAHVYGGEYEDDPHDNQDPVCAVCRSPLVTTIVIPGTNVCPQGWTSQFTGQVMGSPDDHPSGADYVCVDSDMESRPGSAEGNPASELWPTSTVCGSLPCPPYVSGRVLTCAVCSK